MSLSVCSPNGKQLKVLYSLAKIKDLSVAPKGNCNFFYKLAN